MKNVLILSASPLSDYDLLILDDLGAERKSELGNHFSGIKSMCNVWNIELGIFC